MGWSEIATRLYGGQHLRQIFTLFFNTVHIKHRQYTLAEDSVSSGTMNRPLPRHHRHHHLHYLQDVKRQS